MDEIRAKGQEATGIVCDVSEDGQVKRLGRMDEISDAVLWLCSSGSTYVIGQPIAVDGGHTIQ